MKKLCIALQKSGKLADGCNRLFEKSGIKLRTSKNQLLVQDEEFGIKTIFTRDDDIPSLIKNGVCDIGIIGTNLLQEYETNNFNVLMELGFSKCRLSIACLKNINITNLQDLTNKVIATSYPNLLRKFLDQNKINAKIVTMSGSVELAPKIGMADFICDLVSSGMTLKENGLQEFVTIMQSQAVLISKKNIFPEFKQKIIDKLLLRFKSVIKAQKNRYIMLHIDRSKLTEISKLLPGSESPTVLNLNGVENKVAVHVVSLENLFWDTIEKLKAIGATSIQVLPIEKIID